MRCTPPHIDWSLVAFLTLLTMALIAVGFS